MYQDITNLCAIARELAYRWPLGNERSNESARDIIQHELGLYRPSADGSEPLSFTARRLMLHGAELLLDVRADALAHRADQTDPALRPLCSRDYPSPWDGMNATPESYLTYAPMQAYQLDITHDIEELLSRRITLFGGPNPRHTESARGGSSDPATNLDRSHEVAESTNLDRWAKSWLWGATEFGTILIQLAHPDIPYSLDQSTPEAALKRVLAASPALWFQGGIPGEPFMRLVGTNMSAVSLLTQIIAHQPPPLD